MSAQVRRQLNDSLVLQGRFTSGFATVPSGTVKVFRSIGFTCLLNDDLIY